MPSIAPYKDGFRASVKHSGVRVSQVFQTRRLATAWGHKVEAEIDAGMYDESEHHSFASLCDDYMDKVSSTKAGRVWEERRIEVMRKHFGDIMLTDIEAPQIAAWRDRRLKTVTASTVVREANLLRNMFKVAKNEWHWMQHEPFQGVKLPQENEPRHQVWRWQQIKRVLRYQGGHKTMEVIQAFHLSLRTAMRLQEVLAAPGAYDERSRVVTLTPAKTKTKRREYVPVGRIAHKLLQRDEFLVSANEASTLFAKLCKKLLIEDLTFHDARATSLTLLSRKVDVMTLAKISRHKDIRILQNTYYRESPEDIAKRL